MPFIFTSKSIPDSKLKLERYRFEKPLLYKYVVYSFQYADPIVKNTLVFMKVVA